MSADGPSEVSEPVAHKPPVSIYHDSRQPEGSHPPRWPALGQKRTCVVQKGMSALHPKADMCSATRYVRFVPIADIPLTWVHVGATNRA